MPQSDQGPTREIGDKECHSVVSWLLRDIVPAHVSGSELRAGVRLLSDGRPAVAQPSFLPFIVAGLG